MDMASFPGGDHTTKAGGLGKRNADAGNGTLAGLCRDNGKEMEATIL